MARRLDQVLVIDVESTCWQGPPPAGQMSEIIEIGLAPVDLGSLKRIQKRSILVRPRRSSVSPFCTQLTTLTQDMLREAGTLADACELLKRQYDSQDRLWASWGDYDRRQFERVCRELGVRYPFGPTHLNVKTLFSCALGMEKEMGLDAAFAHLGWTMEGTHHRGGDDAWNIAAVLCWLLARARAAGQGTSLT